MKENPIFLDYLSTTPVDPRVVDVMVHALKDHYGNAQEDSHLYARNAFQAIEEARHSIAKCIHTNPESIFWTSGATEANNLAILGATHFYQHCGKHIITTEIEHKSVIEPFRQLRGEGFRVTFLKPNSQGIITVDSVIEALEEDTIFVSISHANNEVGTIQPIADIAKILRKKGILFHVDAAQSVGKIPVDVSSLDIDLLSLSAHKMYGPKGVGALYIRQNPRVHITPLLFGGGQEGRLRPGTLPTHQIVGMAKACEIAQAEMSEESHRLQLLRDTLWHAIQNIPGIVRHGDPHHVLPGVLNIGFQHRNGDALLHALSDLAISRTSACTSEQAEGSHVLRAMGVSMDLAKASFRISVGRFTKPIDLQKTMQIFHRVFENVAEHMIY